MQVPGTQQTFQANRSGQHKCFCVLQEGIANHHQHWLLSLGISGLHPLSSRGVWLGFPCHWTGLLIQLDSFTPLDWTCSCPARGVLSVASNDKMSASTFQRTCIIFCLPVFSPMPEVSLWIELMKASCSDASKPTYFLIPRIYQETASKHSSTWLTLQFYYTVSIILLSASARTTQTSP